MEYAQDEWLISGLAGVEEQIGSLLSKQSEIVQEEAAQEAATTALELATKSLGDCQKQSGIRKQELEDASKQLQQGKGALIQLLGDRLLREYRTEKETLLREMAFLSKIAELLKITGRNWKTASPVHSAVQLSTRLRKGISLSR
jgi:exonuclease SbcC